MKWVLVARTHINTDLVQAFFWTEGQLTIWVVADDVSMKFRDPDRALYLKLCRALGVRPVEEAADGKV